ncbi:uncharacterized protein N7479_004873 [Penicillium vulpinum]|uniref:uncharacterized protein n=1 Tax=Penicillium vulpinum TaxID=29845 RepID=UPI00254863D9|nr:uncharacterized protein N7479_004873 [Penicillium vulpinum]KAJ5964997.1 hypothetical protein N7479_004873 [Penicillium vulpinum]
MAGGQGSHLRRGHSLWVFFAIALGLLCVFFWPHDSKYLRNSNILSRRAAPIDIVSTQPNHTLSRRDDYSCSASKPCSNGACCGAGGYCGYGSTYCGTGCVSNCNATAECGKDASTPGKTCPLNTCCTGCQSNCVLNVPVPGGKASMDVLSNKVIGYYEAWMARKACHKIKPTNLPLDALTHVNFAFASIDPSTYEVVAMDSSTPTSLFQETTNIKSVKEDISVFISIGGWTFSDNGTDTQPLFGEISASETKRKTFANNVVHFMRQYGFDGVDLDWEYPGAGDRGGKPEDTKNYVLLMKTLRETFDASGNTFGLTFTAPSSYWYLRWFDLPSMVKYVDWINVMSYDLHGVWDSDNPIGSIVQGHTNLTEIKSALDLFWRVKIPPAKVVLGIGFYGRAFTLQDKSCTKPGCAFSGASDAGPCSDAGGMLAHYEIMSILQGTSTKRATISPIHDEKAAVNYFTFNDDQWISYDDKTTFKQKIDWANDVGLGGAMVWASDLDDDKYSAHTGLVGRSIISTHTLQAFNKAQSNAKSTITDLSAFTGQKCFKYTKRCIKLDDTEAMSNACGDGYTVVGWDDAGCGKSSCVSASPLERVFGTNGVQHCGKPICCPHGAAPKGCKWRGDDTGQLGSSSDCSGQCSAGEINVNGIRSSWGGGYTNDGNTNKCGRGYKVFCCPDPDYHEVTKGCSWAKCGKECPSGKESVLTLYDNCYSKGEKYCCPTPVELTSCHWTGGSGGRDCVNAKCNSTELQIATSSLGDGYLTCDYSGYCSISDRNDILKRAASELLVLSPVSPSESSLEKRAGKVQTSLTVGALTIIRIIAKYPSMGKLFTIKQAALVLKKAFRTRTGTCGGSVLQITNLPDQPTAAQISGLNSEHPVDKRLQDSVLESMASGILPSGRIAHLKPISENFWRFKWSFASAKLAQKPPVGNSKGKQPAQPNERFGEVFGSDDNPYPFMAVEASLNIRKGKIFELKNPVDLKVIQTAAKKAVKVDTMEEANVFLSKLQVAFAAFEYIRDAQFQARFDHVIKNGYITLSDIEETTETYNLQNWWALWNDDHFTEALRVARRWARDAIRDARAPYIEAYEAGHGLETYDRVMAALDAFEDLIAEIRMPEVKSYKQKNPYNGEGPSGYNS